MSYPSQCMLSMREFINLKMYTLNPAWADFIAATYPPGPPPMTATSKSYFEEKRRMRFGNDCLINIGIEITGIEHSNIFECLIYRVRSFLTVAPSYPMI